MMDEKTKLLIELSDKAKKYEEALTEITNKHTLYEVCGIKRYDSTGKISAKALGVEIKSLSSIDVKAELQQKILELETVNLNYLKKIYLRERMSS